MGGADVAGALEANLGLLLVDFMRWVNRQGPYSRLLLLVDAVRMK
jgi:hypothetical protein